MLTNYSCFEEKKAETLPPLAFQNFSILGAGGRILPVVFAFQINFLFSLLELPLLADS